MSIKTPLTGKTLQRAKYVIGDLVSSSLAWLVYNCLRYNLGAVTGSYATLGEFLRQPMVIVGQVAFPLLMMCIYWLSGYYNEVYRKSRLHEFMVTASSTFTNSLLIFFIALINDVMNDRRSDYEMLLLLFGVIFVFVYFTRMVITSHSSAMIKGRHWSFPTLVVGRGTAAATFVSQLMSRRESLGYDIRGMVSIPGENDVKDVNLPCYTLDDLQQVCEQEAIQEIIVVPTRPDDTALLHTLNRIYPLGLPIKARPSRGTMLLSKVRLTDVYGIPLVDLTGSNMSYSDMNIKRVIDIVLSVLALIVLSPLMAVIAIAIKLQSPGNVFYRQERIGLHNVPFKIIKFRTMVDNAEQDGTPQLTRPDDPRITPLGRFMRKYRIDELPQFYNVIKGDMSIVGPRPERQYYIDRIVKREPAYVLLHQVRPGITSMGMVKFGYAQNVDEMIERLDYDLMYLENMSLLNDFKIMVYTIKIVFTGRGM